MAMRASIGAITVGQEWEVSAREALFRIRGGRWDINKRRKQNDAYNRATSTIAQNAPGLSRGARRNLAPPQRARNKP